MKKRRFTLEKKMVVQVRHYEYMYLIRDDCGTNIYVGNNEKLAKSTLQILNRYLVSKERKSLKLSKRPKTRKPKKKPDSPGLSRKNRKVPKRPKS